MINLVTTALFETYDKKNKNFLLGEWCKIFDDNRSKSFIFDLNNHYHWNDRIKLKKDYFYLSLLYEKILIHLINDLNNYHETNYGEKYWRIVLGPWLALFLHTSFDRWENIRLLKKKNIPLQTKIINIKEIDIIPLNYEEQVRYTPTDIWNHYIYSKIIKEQFNEQININYIDVDYNGKKNPNTGSMDINLKEIQKIKKTYRSFFSKFINKIYLIFNLLQRNNKYFFFETYFGKLFETKINLFYGQLPILFKQNNYYTEKPNKLDRDNLTISFDAINNFETFIKKHIKEFIPISFLENFKLINNNISKNYLPKKLKIILTSHILRDTNYARYCAQQIESGAKLIHGQHGGVYGQYKFSWSEDHELKISDKYLTWGWNDSNNKIYPFGLIKPINNIISGNNKKINKCKDLLIIIRARARYTQLINSSTGSVQFLDYINSCIRFGEGLSNNILNKNLLLRFHTRKFHWLEEERWRKRFGHINIDWGDKPLTEMINKSRIVVSSYIATSYLETLAANVPTVVFENLDNTELNDECLDQLNELKKVGIFFDDPFEAASFINKIWENVEKWWFSEELQLKIKNFNKIYARNNKSKIAEIKKIISKVNQN